MAEAAEAEKRLVWQSEYEAQNLSGKALFQHFIGAHTKLWKKVRAFPMLLWAEQAQALASGALPDKQQKRQNRKRNRSSDAGDAEAEEEEQRRVKVKTEGWFDSAVALFRMVATAVMSPITYVSAIATSERAEREDENKKEEEEEGATVDGDAATRMHQEWRSKVFLDLTKQGYLVGPGAAYGGDYVIYRSDPHKEHSMACVRIIHGGTEPLFRDVATFARVCRKARKTAVLALGGDDGTIKYISAGFAGVISYAKNKGKTRGARRKPLLAQDVEDENPAQLLDENAEATDSDSGDEAYFSDVSADL